MEVVGDSLDEVLVELYQALLGSPYQNEGSRGNTLEFIGVSLRIRKPRARLSRSESRGKAFSALGELLWYLSGSDRLEFIEPYVPMYEKEAVDGSVHGAYGPRLLKMRGSVNQLDNVARLLGKKRNSRRAVVQLFDAEDISSDHKEIPCTTTLQFHLRDGALHTSVTLRSNDAYLGLPHDVFCFTMLQEMMACRLGAALGEYFQYVGSMHIYTDKIEQVRRYLGEGHHRVVEMPPMPACDPFELLPELLRVEERLRRGESVSAAATFSTEYWADIVRLLEAFWAKGNNARLDEIEAEFAYRGYRTYIQSRRGTPG
jgi:thymidylate synthase